jgi:methionine-gamma-lyase
MKKSMIEWGMGTLVNHVEEGHDPLNSHVLPIYQSATFRFPDAATGAAIMHGDQEGYVYTRLGNPNWELLRHKYAVLEGLDLLRGRPDAEADQVVSGQVFASGMAAITGAILARVHSGETIVAQEDMYGNAYSYLSEIAPKLGLQVVWVKDVSQYGWEAALHEHPDARLVYAETPANPTMLVVDLGMLSGLAHQYGSWLMVDNTFATPYCQRPLSLGADIVVHSTTKYLSGHGVIIGGAVISSHLDFMRQDLQAVQKLYGGVPSPFDAWLANLGLRTFELRMQRHCENALAVARYLEAHPKVARVHYPGLESHPGHAIAKKQMHCFGGMLSFELAGGYQAGEMLMNRVEVATLAVSLGNVDSLIQHPASMTHSAIPADIRRKMGISDGLVRFSVGIENIEDILADLDQGLRN